MADVFVSYAREDKARAEQVAGAVGALGFDVFWDSEVPPGQSWADYIESKLSQCKVMIVLWSATSTRSQWVREEARMARDRGVLIPVMLDDSPPPFGFGEVQAANLATWRGEPDHAEWRRLVNAINAAAGAPTRAPHAAPPPRAPQSFASAPAEGQLSPWGYVQKCLRLYINAQGRARRAEYWWWTAFVFAVSVVAGVLDASLFGYQAQLVSALAGLALLAPGLCVTIRRFHDVGLTGWFVLAVFAAVVVGGALAEEIPALGGLIVLAAAGAVLVIALMPSKPGPNAYGPNPKGA
jgi:uncharacterized membrane protein YhaH (DUF805 family)